MATKSLEQKFLAMDRAAYGIRHYKEGNYGTIALRWRDHLAADNVTHKYAYILSGVHNKSGAFPGVPAWNEAINAIAGSQWKRSKARWVIPVTDKAAAEEINAALAPVLKDAIRAYTVFRRENRQRYLSHHPDLAAPP